MRYGAREVKEQPGIIADLEAKIREALMANADALEALPNIGSVSVICQFARDGKIRSVLFRTETRLE